MNLHELFCLKEKLLGDVLKETKPEDFPNQIAYKQHLHSMEEGIYYFYANAMIQILDSMPDIEKKKSA